MSEIPPPSTSRPELGGVAGRDSAADGLPARFGKYTLLRKLAMGGMAELFLAIQRSMAGFEKLIVIKRILPWMNQDRSFVDMLLHEARVAATLSHPNVVQIFDVGQVDGTYFIAMEHVHGEDLRSIVRQMKRKGVHEFPLEHAVSILSGVCAGLAYAHEKRDLDGTALRIVHRDISPQNVVVTFTGDVKIVDFGIAKSDANLGEETRSGKLKGKVPYMSPEQARGDAVDWRSDIFSVGVILFELTTGKRLFKGQSDFETLKLVVERDYPYPSTVRAGYPRELERIVMRALEKDRTLRYQNAREMQSDLEAFVHAQRIPTSTIALSQFMQGLFEDKLESQKKALLQGKELADIIGLHHDRDSGEFEGSVHPSATTSVPAAANTITKGGTVRRGGIASVLMALVLLLCAGGVGAYFTRHRADSPAAPVAATRAIVVSGDPVAATTRLPVGTGTLTVTATGGGCAVRVDDAPRGATPMAGLELGAGAHKVSCTTAEGKTQSATVSVPVDGTARQQFTLTP